LRFSRREQRSGDARDVEYIDTQLYELDSSNGEEILITPAGMLNRVRQTLGRAGVEVDYKDITPLELEPPAYETVGPMLREGQDEIIAKVIAHPRGIIHGPTGAGKSYLIRVICLLYPTTPIVICVHRKSILDTFYRVLLEYFPEEQVGRIGDGHREIGRRITLLIRNSLPRAHSEGVLEACRIFMFDEVHEAGGRSTAENLSFVPHAKMIGWTASPNMRSDCADRAIEAIFGQVLISVPYQTEVERGNISQIMVEFTPVLTGPDLSNIQQASARNRHGIWRNRIRNQIIAESVRADVESGMQVLITVNTVEHAVYLKQFLPNFDLVYGATKQKNLNSWAAMGMLDINEHPLRPKEVLRKQHAFEAGDLRAVIATSIWDTGVDFCELGVLARANADASNTKSIQGPGRLSRLYDEKEYGLLRDYGDEWDGIMQRRADTRRRQYRKQGWPIK
jgi:superfamily II DNA or RNA helicase